MKLFTASMAVLVGISFTAQAADSNPDHLKALVGKYHVLQYNDDHSPTGTLRVRADSQFGFALTPLSFPDKKSPASNVPSTELISPQAMTTVTKEGMVVKQVAQIGNRKIEISYENYGDFMIVQGTDCNEGCTATKITVGKTGSFGSTISSTQFLKEVKGNYATTQVGGLDPKESTRELVTEPDFNGNGLILAPYCDKNETFCDGGMLVFAEDKTKVWHRNLGGGHHIYDIFASDAGFGMAAPGYYRWEEKPNSKGGKEIRFRNMQYLLPNGGGEVCMEHVAQSE